MKHRHSTALLAMLLALASSQASASVNGTRPLRLGFVAPPERAPAPRVERSIPQQLGRADSRRGVRPHEVADQPKLHQRAIESILDPPSPALAALDEAPSGGQLQLRFQKRGNAFRDLSKGYREMCDKASAKIWDDPNGKRVRFDVRGKPGIGIEIPIR